MSYILEVKYYNSFVVKKIENNNSLPNDFAKFPIWPGLPWNPVAYPVFPGDAQLNPIPANNWFIEESRIRGGYNNSSVSLGVKAYINEENSFQENRPNSLIYSGVFNSRTGINNTNVFSIGEPITKDLNPENGSIQLLHTEDTNLNIFQEQKVSYVLINKDTIYSGSQGAKESAGSTPVLGQVVPYLGKYGISKNPESFAFFGSRKYFTDSERGLVLRLSGGAGGGNGITEISNYGMKDYFRDEMGALSEESKPYNIPWEFGDGQVFTNSVSSFKIKIANSNANNNSSCKVLKGSLFQITNSGVPGTTGAIVTNVVDELPIEGFSVVTITLNKPILITSPTPPALTPIPKGLLVYYFKSKIIGGWDNYAKNYTLSFQNTPSYIDINSNYSTLCFDETINGWTSFYSFKPSSVFSSNGKLYSTTGNNIYEHHLGNFLQYYGRNYQASIEFIFNSNPSLMKNFQTINYEGDNGWQMTRFETGIRRVNLTYPTQVGLAPYYGTENFDSSSGVLSYSEGAYTQNGYNKRAGFNKKNNYYMSNLINNSSQSAGEVRFGNVITGIKGYFGRVKITTDQTTDINGSKEIWSVGTKFI